MMGGGENANFPQGEALREVDLRENGRGDRI